MKKFLYSFLCVFLLALSACSEPEEPIQDVPQIQEEEEQIDDVAKCYRHVYQSGTSVFNAVRRIEADVPESEVRQEVVDFIKNNDMKIVALPISTID